MSVFAPSHSDTQLSDQEKVDIVVEPAETRWQYSWWLTFGFTHIEMVWGDIHQLLVTGVQSFKQQSVSSFAVQADLTLWVTHWKSILWRQNTQKDPYNSCITFKSTRALSLLHRVGHIAHGCLSGYCVALNECVFTAQTLVISLLCYKNKILLRQKWIMIGDFWAAFQHLTRKHNTGACSEISLSDNM